MQLFTIFSYFMDGFAYAGEALTGKYIGAKQPESLKEMFQRIFRWGLGIAIAFTLIYALTGEQFLQLLTNESSVILASKEYFFWVILIPLTGYSAFLMDGIFIGATRTRYMLWGMLAASFAFFTCYIGLKETGNHALWAAFIIYLSIRGIVQRILARKILQ
jgi:MATE family multidrug resistance protein